MPARGSTTATLPRPFRTSSAKRAVFEPSTATPPWVAASLACDGIAELGRTSSVIANAASSGPVVKMSPMLITARPAAYDARRKFFENLALYTDITLQVSAAQPLYLAGTCLQSSSDKASRRRDFGDCVT